MAAEEEAEPDPMKRAVNKARDAKVRGMDAYRDA